MKKIAKIDFAKLRNMPEPEYHNNKPTSQKMKIHAVDTKNMSLMEQALSRCKHVTVTNQKFVNSNFPY